MQISSFYSAFAMATPRVNKGFLPQYRGQVVRLIGTVMASSEAGVDIRASDGGIVRLMPSSGTFQVGEVWEVIGRVRDDFSLEELNSIQIPSTPAFDFENFEALVQLTHLHPDIFGTIATQ